MAILKISLHSFRNHLFKEIDFFEGLTVIWGENGSGKWKRTIRTKSGATSSIPVHKLPKYKNVLTGKITFDPVMYEKQY